VQGLLESEWGKTPRTIGELRRAMEANAIYFPKTTLSGVLVWMVKKGSLRRWKDRKRGYLYMQNSEEGAVAEA
jgi:predicted transcriptional regulator